MLTNTESSLDGLITVKESPADSQSAFYNLVNDVAEEILQKQRINYEKRLWDLPLDYNLIDHLDEIVEYEAALTLVNRGIIPTDNFYFQSVVVRLAYDAITDAVEFAWICENSRFTQEEVQKLIDTAASTVLWHKNFALESMLTYQQKQATDLMYLYGNRKDICQSCGK